MTVKTLFLTIATAAALAGCASAFNPAGDSHYDCNRKENPNSPYCHSFRAVEEATNGSVPSSRYDEQMDLRSIDQLTGIAPVGDKQARPTTNNTANAALAALPLPHQDDASELPEGTPVRMAPVVQRIWIASRRDGNDVLHGEEYLYREIVPARWAGQPALTAGQQRVGFGNYPHRAPAPTAAAPANPSDAPSQAASTRTTSQPSNFNQPGAQKPIEPQQTDTNDSASSMPQ